MPWQGAGLILGQLLLCNGWDLGWTPTVISQQHRLYISLICYYYILLYSGPSQLPHTLVYRIDVHARLLILRKKSPLHGLILVCTFIDFEKKFPPARLFCPACLMFFKNFSTCTFILACTSIQYTRVPGLTS